MRPRTNHPASANKLLLVAGLLSLLQAVAYSSQLPGLPPLNSPSTWIRTTLTGHVRYGLGHPVARAKISFRNNDTRTTKKTRADVNGKYVVSLPPGSYIVTVEAVGYQTLTTTLSIPEITVAEEVRDFALKETEHRAFTHPFWNVWTENYETDSPTYERARMKPGESYLVVVNIAALRYENYKYGIFSHEVSERFDSWLQQATRTKITLQVLAIPDERFFERQDENQRVRPLTIELAKMKKAQKDGFELVQGESPFDRLARNHGRDSFNFGTVAFRVRTKTGVAGRAAIAFSFWYGDTPIEELSYSACVAAKSGDEQCNSESVSYGLEGIIGTNRSGKPDAALHFVELNSENLIGVFRCNTCRWKAGEFRTWSLGGGAKWFQDQFAKTVLPGIQNGANGNQDSDAPAYNETTFENAGDALHGLLFHSEAQDPSSIQAAAAFRSFFIQSTKNEANGNPPGSLFVRFLPKHLDQSFVVPLGLTHLQVAGADNGYIGFHLKIEIPLALQDYTSSSACPSHWVLMVPPGDIKDSTLNEARVMFQDWIDRFRKTDAVIYDETDLHRFKEWINRFDEAPEESDAILILSHHRDNSIFLDRDKSELFATNVRRPFAQPSIAIIDACGTANPGAFEFVREFNLRGIYSIIATSVDVDARMGGAFLKIFADQLDRHADDRHYTVDRATFDTIKILSDTPDAATGPGRKYGPRALIFSLIGNGKLRLCVPPKSD